MILPAAVVLHFSPGLMSSDIHIQKALLAPRKSSSQLFHLFAELLEFMKTQGRGPYAGGQLSTMAATTKNYWKHLANQGHSLCACHVLPVPFLSSLLLHLAGICSFWQAAENPVFSISP